MCFESSFTYHTCRHTIFLSRHCEKGTCIYQRKDLHLPIGFCENCFAEIGKSSINPRKCLPLSPALLVECKTFWDDPNPISSQLSHLVSFRDKCNKGVLNAQSDLAKKMSAYKPDDIKLLLDLPNVKSDIEHKAAISQQGYLYRWLHQREMNLKDYWSTIMIHRAAIAGQICYSEVDDILVDQIREDVPGDIDECQFF
ncbi:hypothetical protein CJF31_00008500 [Rutstroemia sp. NJR-2017a BVV2]|nr:hypothetical protein CJF31_00008500 [Rutstroemia sp. NJR-2017a BVV2]